jgi:hypothetical protein
MLNLYKELVKTHLPQFIEQSDTLNIPLEIESFERCMSLSILFQKSATELITKDPENAYIAETLLDISMKLSEIGLKACTVIDTLNTQIINK